MAETETDLAARVDQLESVVLKLAELVAGVNMHTNSAMGELLKPLQARTYNRRDMKAEA